MKTLSKLLFGGMLLAAVLRVAGQPATTATFTRITSGDIATNVANAFGCAWGDYDDSLEPADEVYCNQYSNARH